MKITGLVGDSCPNGVSCARVHDTDGDDVLVQAEVLVTDPQVRADAGVPAHEHLVQVPRTALYPPELSPDELATWIFDRFGHEVVRIEGLKAYDADSDSEEGKRIWQTTLDRFRSEGRAWRVVRLMRGEPSGYELDEVRTYLEHVEHGEDIVMLDVPPKREADLDGVPDFFVIDGQHVVRSIYTATGRLLGGQVLTGPEAAVFRALARALYAEAVDVRSWATQHRRQLAA